MTLPALPAQGSTAWYPWASGIHTIAASTGLNVKAYGATGNGSTDDSAAIKAAEAALTSGGTLYFPRGSYRFATQNPTGGAALLISGKSNVTVVFEAGAEILMDNLSGGSGTSHGISVRGLASDITLINPKVRWGAAPATRSTGDGITFLGYPSDSAPAAGWTGSTGKLSNIRVVNPTVVNAPQTGLIFMGCSDVTIENARVENTQADALHLNANRRVHVNQHTAVGCGDDGLAFVTYHHATTIWQSSEGPFNQNGLTEWSNTNSTANGITASNGTANGCRIAGARNVAISDLVAVGNAVAGLIMDSAIANGSSILWSYKASRGVSVDNALCETNPIGFRAATQNITSADDPTWWTFDARIDGLTVRDASNWSIRTEGNGSAASAIAGLHVANIKVTTGSSGGAIGFSALRNSYVGALVMESTTGATCGFYGADATYTGALSALPQNNVIVDKVDVRGGRVLFQDFNGLVCGSIRTASAPNSGVEFVNVTNAEVGNLRVVRAHRSNSGLSRGLLLAKTANVDVTQLVIEHDANTTGTWVSLEIGGGDATDPAARGLRVEKVVYTNTINQAAVNNTVVQGGGFGPVSYYARVQYYNGGETTPVWRTSTLGTLPVFP